MVAYTYNTNCLGGREQEDCGLGQQGQKVSKTPISINKPSVVPHACDPSYEGGLGKKKIVEGWSQSKT
jgi:hypothetical protein